MQYKIGLAYDFSGFTQGIDKREACKWYESAAWHGHKGAKMRLNELLVMSFQSIIVFFNCWLGCNIALY